MINRYRRVVNTIAHNCNIDHLYQEFIKIVFFFVRKRTSSFYQLLRFIYVEAKCIHCIVMMWGVGAWNKVVKSFGEIENGSEFCRMTFLHIQCMKK